MAPLFAGLILAALAQPAVAAPKLGPRIAAGAGADPDLAAGPGGTLHLAYTRSKKIYYRTVGAGGKLSAEQLVADGVDPGLAVDAGGLVHVVMVSGYSSGTVSYTRRNKGVFSKPVLLSQSAACRKPRIALDPSGRAVVSFEDKAQTKRIRYVRVALDGKVSAQTVVGDDNNGGLAIDAAGIIHVTWRSKEIYYNISSGPGKAGASVKISPLASDFSQLALRAQDKSVHVVGEVANAGGIYYISRGSGTWTTPQVLAKAQAAVKEPDDVNPAIAVANDGRCYITFNGVGHVPYYFVVDAKGKAGPPAQLDPGGGASAGKYMNPNLTPSPGGGVYAAWGTIAQKVFLRSITFVPTPPNSDGGQFSDSRPPDARPGEAGQVDGPRDRGAGPSADGAARDKGAPPADELEGAGCSCQTGRGPGPGPAALAILMATLWLGRRRSVRISEVGAPGIWRKLRFLLTTGRPLFCIFPEQVHPPCNTR